MGLGTQLDGCGQCMKYTLWLVNFICLVGGLTVLGVGIWVVVDQSYMEELLGSDLYISAAYIMVATGVIITLLALIGCVGAIKEIKCLLLTYALLLFLIFIILLVGGILGYVFRGKVGDTIETEMRNSLNSYGDKTSVTRAWDDVQKSLKCCGVTSYTDWGSDIPNSCCSGNTNCNRDTSYKIGCLNEIKDNVKANALIVGAVAIAIAILLLFGIIFSCTLFKSIK